MLKNIKQLRNELENKKTRSAWEAGVKQYAFDFLDTLEDWQEYEKRTDIPTGKELKEALLNGAKDWNQLSWGGSSLCYDGQIAERLCAPWELKKTKNGANRPNAREEWLDVQARALFQAYLLIKNIIQS